MKKNLVSTVFFILILMWVPTRLMGQSMVASVGVDKDDVDLRGSVQILDSLTIQVSEAGKALLRFEGYCTATPGDKIFLAVSETRVWGACDDNINIEVPDNDVNTAPFSHTRVFNLLPGSHTFYAVAHNHIELEGTGIGSIHGTLLAEFFNANEPVLVDLEEIAMENRLVRNNTFIFGSISLLVPEAGKVLVHFDGLCVSTPGDLIALGASDATDFAVQNGAVLLEAYSGDLNTNSFSHSKVYEVGPGINTFYALGENFQKMDGNGRISVFGSLSTIFYPDKIKTDLQSHEIAFSAIDVRSSDRTLGQITIESESGGLVLVQFNGMTGIQPGDRISFAVSDNDMLPSSMGNMILESLETEKPYRSFSQSRVFNIGPGEHTFYMIARNKDETDGTGVISSFGNLIVVYQGSEVISSSAEASMEEGLTIAPNPSNEFIHVSLGVWHDQRYSIELIDLQGRIHYATLPGSGPAQVIDVRPYPTGMYFIRVRTNSVFEVRQVVIH